jgi:hypothetical protein
MKKIKISIFIALFMCMALPNAEALLDIFIVYGKRNNAIEKIILEALNTPTKEWERIRVPIPEKYESDSSYAPKGSDRKDPSTAFFFSECYFAKHPTLHTLDDLYSNSIVGSLYVSFKPIFRDEKTVAFEIVNSSNKASLKEHTVKWIVDLGGSNFRAYTYRTKYENLREEEVTFWLDLFKYMEEQIKHVKS